MALRLGREQFLGGSLAGLDRAVEVALGVDRGVLAGEVDVALGLALDLARRVYWPTFQNEYDPLDQGLPSQKSTVTRPFHFAVIPGRSGSSWASNCWARLVGVPEPKPAPTVPPV